MNASNYTMHNKLKFDRKDAMKYLYHNGSLPLDTSRELYLQGLGKTTICNHIRLIYGLSWHESKEVFYLILYCITDSKAVVGHLRNIKDNREFDSGWWQQEAITPKNPYLGGRDSFYDTKIPFKSKDITDKDILAARALLCERNTLPKIYLAYRTLHEIFLSWNHHRYKDDLCLATLECVHLRYRLDRKVVEWESKSFGEID